MSLPKREPILLENALILNPGEPPRRANIYIEEDRIAGLGSESYPKHGVVVDASKYTVTPGLYASHTHLGLYPVSKIIGEWVHLDEWAEKIAWKWEPHLSPEDSRNAAIMAVYDYLSKGIVGIADMHFNMDVVAEVVYYAGIRGNLSVAIMNKGFYDNEWKALKDNLELASKWHKKDNGRIIVSLGPCTIRLVSKELLEEVARIKREKNLGVHMHVAEVYDDEKYCSDNYGVSLIEFLYQRGILGENTILAHGVWLSSKEIELISMFKSTIIHNPVTNMLLGSGIAKIREMIDRNVNVTIGLDISPTQNIFDEVFAALLASRLRRAPISVIEAYRLATINSSKVLNAKIGAVKKDYKADIIIWNTRSSRIEDLIVEKPKPYYVIVDGRILVNKGEIVSIDRKEYLKAKTRIMSRVEEVFEI